MPGMEKARKRKTLLYAFMLVALTALIVAIWISRSPTSLPTSNIRVSINAEVPSMSIDATSTQADYMCLASSEYGQLYLPKEFQCHSCFVSDENREIIDRQWRPDILLLVLRTENSFSVSEVNLSEITGRGLDTWYSIANRPDAFPAMSQCTAERLAVAHCAEQSGDCLFLFRRQPD
jgi:hypothetical protein